MGNFRFAVALVVAGCAPDHHCTLKAVPNRLTIEAEPPIDADGVWRIEADGLGCTVSLPLAGGTVACDVAATFQTSGDRLSGVTVQYAADEVALRVLWDEEEVFREVRAPDWSVSEPNGAGCGITRVGTETIVGGW